MDNATNEPHRPARLLDAWNKANAGSGLIMRNFFDNIWAIVLLLSMLGLFILMLLIFMPYLVEIIDRLPGADQGQIAYSRSQIALLQQSLSGTGPRDGELCKLRAICVSYSRARQDCATAGDFNNCINVKMGYDFSQVNNCTNDGDILYSLYSPQMPSKLQCQLRLLFGGGQY
jgi:hypothetical protein